MLIWEKQKLADLQLAQQVVVRNNLPAREIIYLQQLSANNPTDHTCLWVDEVKWKLASEDKDNDEH